MWWGFHTGEQPFWKPGGWALHCLLQQQRAETLAQVWRSGLWKSELILVVKILSKTDMPTKICIGCLCNGSWRRGDTSSLHSLLFCYWGTDQPPPFRSVQILYLNKLNFLEKSNFSSSKQPVEPYLYCFSGWGASMGGGWWGHFRLLPGGFFLDNHHLQKLSSPRSAKVNPFPMLRETVTVLAVRFPLQRQTLLKVIISP